MESILLTGLRRIVIRAATQLVFVTVVLFPAGCMYSFQPLYTNDDTTFEPALLGTWEGEIPRTDMTPVGKHGELPKFRLNFKTDRYGGYEMTLNLLPASSPVAEDSQEPQPSTYDVRLVRLADSTYADIYPRINPLSFQLGMVAVHVIAAFRIRNDDLEILLFGPQESPNWPDLSRTDIMPWCGRDSYSPVLTADTATLRHFLEKHGSQLLPTEGIKAHRAGASATGAAEATPSISPLNDAVKAGLHVIQMALERYAVAHDGLYPPFLTGGDMRDNMLSPKALHKQILIRSGVSITLGPPAALSKDWKLSQNVTAESAHQSPPLSSDVCKPRDGGPVCADPLLLEGFFSVYPANPYAPVGAAVLGSPGVMHELSLGWGDGVVFELPPPTSDVKNGRTPAAPVPIYPGNFYYHPYYCDGVSNAAHNTVRLGAPTAQKVFSDAVCGYVLVGLSSPGEPGLDATGEMPLAPAGPTFACLRDLSNPSVFARVPGARTLSGYFNYEADPFRCLPSTPTKQSLPGGSGPDGKPDHILTILYGGLEAPVRTLPSS